ncbi:MAG: YlxR family protein [Cyanobacteriota bacterium]|nr:YlxR family protein [Cyanobacteriota bacterium]
MTAKVVLRRCVACRQLVDRDQLWRVIRLAEGGIALDQGQGRSAYLCPTAACLEDARKHKRLQRGLRAQVADSILKRLESRLAGNADACSEAR